MYRIQRLTPQKSFQELKTREKKSIMTPANMLPLELALPQDTGEDNRGPLELHMTFP